MNKQLYFNDNSETHSFKKKIILLSFDRSETSARQAPSISFIDQLTSVLLSLGQIGHRRTGGKNQRDSLFFVEVWGGDLPTKDRPEGQTFGCIFISKQPSLKGYDDHLMTWLYQRIKGDCQIKWTLPHYHNNFQNRLSRGRTRDTDPNTTQLSNEADQAMWPPVKQKVDLDVFCYNLKIRS